jgi:hypothetical protein
VGGVGGVGSVGGVGGVGSVGSVGSRHRGVAETGFLWLTLIFIAKIVLETRFLGSCVGFRNRVSLVNIRVNGGMRKRNPVSWVGR